MKIVPNCPEKIKLGLLLHDKEDIAPRVLEILRRNELDVEYIADERLSAEGREVFELAAKERRVIVTFDRGFGYLVFKKNLQNVPGVILLRFDAKSPEEVEIKLESLLTKYRDKLLGSFTVVKDNSVRIRPLRSIL